jgi:four helix bundle protein
MDDPEGRFPMAQSFRELQVWQKAMQLTIAIYQLTRSFPRDELYGLTGQLRRAAISVPSNIAEGHGRLSNREFTQFLSIARGSLRELQTLLEIAQALGFGTVKAIEDAERLSHEVGKMIFAFLGSLKTQPVRTLSKVNH